MTRTLFVFVLYAATLTHAAPAHATTDWCDDPLTRRYAAAYDYTIDCRDEPNEHAGWADHANRRIVIWPDAAGSPEYIRKTLIHELGHVVAHNQGLPNNEQAAETFSWCVRPEPVRYFLNNTPDPATCDSIVGDPVVHAYAAFLGRYPEDDGWSYWVSLDLPQHELHAAIAASPEAQ